MNKMPILLIPEKADIEFEQVFSTWTKRGGQIRQLGKYWVKDEELAKQEIAIYGNQTFALVLAQIYNVTLISPDDTLIARLDEKWTKRSLQVKTIDFLHNEEHFPLFVKPVIPKLFLAGVFENILEFAEARSYIKGGIIMDIATYEGMANLDTARNFLTDFIGANKYVLPKVVVVDLAYNNEIGWFILEFNACWGAGLNNCNAEKVIECIISATISDISTRETME